MSSSVVEKVQSIVNNNGEPKIIIEVFHLNLFLKKLAFLLLKPFKKLLNGTSTPIHNLSMNNDDSQNSQYLNERLMKAYDEIDALNNRIAFINDENDEAMNLLKKEFKDLEVFFIFKTLVKKLYL